MSDLLQILTENARNEAIQLEHPYIRSEHLLLALLKIDAEALSITYEHLFARITALPKPSCGAEQKLTLAKGAKRALQAAQESTDELSTDELAEHILESSPILRRILNQLGEGDNATAD